MYAIREIEKNNSCLWNTFVYSNQKSDYTHLFEWKSIYKESYALRSIFLGAFDQEKLIAILPTALIKYPFKKVIAYSLPYLNYCGILKSEEYDEHILIEDFFNYLKQKEVGGIELRQLNTSSSHKEEICTLKLLLPNSEDGLWNSFKPKVRNQIRKALKYGFEIKWGKAHLDSFYKIYSKNMKDLGTPVHSKRFFEMIIENFPAETDLITIYKGTTAVASMFLMKYKKSLSDPWASSLKEYLEYCPNMLMYWEALKFGCINNFTEFDFGRSRINSGTFRFKTQWGAKPIPLKYSFFPFDQKKRVASNSSYHGKTANLFVNIWKMIPYRITLLLGPKLRKYIP